MLSKLVCQACYSSGAEGKCETRVWRDNTDSWWDKEQLVFCPVSKMYTGINRNIKNLLMCPYRMEHTLVGPGTS